MEIDEALAHVFAAGSREMDRPLLWYFSRPVIAARAIVYALAFFALALGAGRVRPEPAPKAKVIQCMTNGPGRWFGPAGLISVVFLLHLLATDWIIMLDPGWFSTGFPLVWIAAQAIAGVSLAIAAAVWFGAQPAERGEAGHVRGQDWGNLMLAAIMVWAYVAFVQLLIIWSGNLPAETSWYRHRDFGAWRWWATSVALIEFGAPFFLLLSRGLKRRRRGLALITALLLLGQIGYTAWIIVPAFPEAAAHAPWLLASLVIAALALFLNRYLAGARTVAMAVVSP